MDTCKTSTWGHVLAAAMLHFLNGTFISHKISWATWKIFLYLILAQRNKTTGTLVGQAYPNTHLTWVFTGSRILFKLFWLQGKDPRCHHQWERSLAASASCSSWKSVLFSLSSLLLLTTFTHLNVICIENKLSCIKCLAHLSDNSVICTKIRI